MQLMAPLFLAALHGEAVPDAVDGAAVEHGVLGVPVDGLELDLPVVASSDLLGELEVKAGVLAVVANVAVGRVGRVKANDEGAGVNGSGSGLGVVGAGGCAAAAGEHRNGQGCRGERGEDERPSVQHGISFQRFFSGESVLYPTKAPTNIRFSLVECKTGMPRFSGW